MAAKKQRRKLAEQPIVQRKQKILWHRLLGKWLELLLTYVDVTVYTEPQVMSDPPKVDILLLRRNSPTWTPPQTQLLPDGVRDSAASHILVEFKFTESLNRARFQQALGYDYFYRQAQKVPETAVQTFIFSAKTPPPALLQEYGYSVIEHPGVYRSANPLLQPVGLLLLNELRPELHNAFIQSRK